MMRFSHLGDAAHQDNSGPGGGLIGPVVRSPADYAACQAYIVKYRRVFGHDPVGIWCAGLPPPDVVYAPQPPVLLPPVTHEDPRSPISSGPVWRHRPRRLPRRPVVRRAYRPPEEAGGELCPIAGYVRRPIPGVSEEQVFRCTPGRPVIIDPGLRAVGTQEAHARHGIAGLDDLGFVVGNIDVPSWLPLIAVAVGVFLYMKRR